MRRKAPSRVRLSVSLLLRAVASALLAGSALLVEYAKGVAIRSVCGVADVMLSGLVVLLAAAPTKRTHCLHSFNAQDVGPRRYALSRTARSLTRSTSGSRPPRRATRTSRMTTMGWAACWSRQGNGTLMARAPRPVILAGAFCLVELTRLEHVTSCLQRSWT